jgi:hypothetical protein
MSEPKPDYVIDALEMMGISEPRKIVTEVSGFIPVFEVVLHHYKDYMTALVFGRMWQYCNMSDGVCKASLERIGGDLEISSVTVMRHAEKLVADGYLIDTTPDRRNAPHEYLDGRKVEMKSRITAGMTKSNATVINSKASVINSQLIKQDNTNKQIGDDFQETKNTAYRRGEQEAPDKVAALLEMANFPGAKLQARLDSILSYLGGALQRNTETKEWKEFAKYVDSEKQTKGWDVKVFVEWMKSQKGYDPSYWSCRRMREFYPMAFIQDNEPKDWQDRSHAL